MMLLEYQNLNYSNKPADGLDAYCRLEGLDSVYIRSLQRLERNRNKSETRNVRKFLSRLFDKNSLRENRPGFAKRPGYGESPEKVEILECRKGCECC